MAQTELRQVMVEEVDPLDAYVDEILGDEPESGTDDAKAEGAQEDGETETEELEAADDTEESTEEAEPEYLEFKYNGQKVKKSIDEVLDLAEKGMGADLKFREAADMRKAVEAQAQQLQVKAQLQQATQAEQVQLAALDMQLAQYSNVDWNAFVDQDHLEAQKQWQKFQLLDGLRKKLASDVDARMAQIQTLEAQRINQLQAQGTQALQNELGKDWNPQTIDALIDTGSSVYGFTDEELKSILDPRMVKVLLDAHKWQQLQSSKVQTNKKVSEAPKLAKPGSKPVPENSRRKQLQKMLKSSNRSNREKAAYALMDDFVR
jgi:hypothetical protein